MALPVMERLFPPPSTVCRARRMRSPRPLACNGSTASQPLASTARAEGPHAFAASPMCSTSNAPTVSAANVGGRSTSAVDVKFAAAVAVQRLRRTVSDEPLSTAPVLGRPLPVSEWEVAVTAQ